MIELPFPHKVLWPNGRTKSTRWKAAESRKHKQWAHDATKAYLSRFDVPAFPARLAFTVRPKPRGPMPDKDNASAAMKAYQDGIALALGTYYKDGADNPDENNALAGKAFSMVPRIIAARGRYADRPYMRDLFYARACIRNRMYCNERVAIDLLERAYLAGAHIEELKDWAKQARNWTNWRTEMEGWIDELAAPEGDSEQ